MRKDAQSGYYLALGTYIMLHFLILLIFCLYPNDISDSCTNNEFSCLYFPTLKLAATFFYFFAKTNPGYLSKSNLNPESELLSSQDWDPPAQNFCEICKMTQPYRAHHCKKCEECVATFDHHCFWIGTCIGEFNHARFVVYLVLESVAIDWACYNSLSGMIEDDQAYGAFVVSFMICLLFGVLTNCLCGLHIYLLLTNVTTYELIHKESIPYYKPYPSNFNPFDKGIFQNIKTAVLAKEITNYSLPQPRPVYPFNWCDNEYWSCF